MARFHKDMSIFQALEAEPGARDVFESHGMSCCLCIGPQSLPTAVFGEYAGRVLDLARWAGKTV